MRIRRTVGPAFLTSLVWHVAVIVALIVVAGSRRSGPADHAAATPATTAQLVFLNRPGPAGGGGRGGGDRTLTPPRHVEVRGHDRLSVPAAQPPALTPAPAPAPEPLPSIVIPVQMLGASIDTIRGALEAPVSAATTRGPGDGSSAGPGGGTGEGPGLGPGLGPGRGGNTGDGPYQPGNGVTSPIELRRAVPRYTTSAMQARIQGVVLVECVVDINGMCRSIRVLRSLDAVHGLDQEAVNAAGEWRFRPGTRLGKPVPVVVTMEITFTLR